jgi:predicted transglutaminase-like cysteine proteinase
LADHGGTEREKLDRVNRFFNRVPYVSDFQNWNKKDYWATPIEVLGVNAADCEDYAIAKYFTLTELGVPSEKLRITYVKAVELQEAHMVLSYYEQEDEIPLILDNLRDEILPATKRKDLVPVYSFNAESIWSAVSRGQGKKLGSSSRIKLWEQLKQKMQEEIKKGA